MFTVTDKDFDLVLKSHKVVLIDFWAEWCRPCKLFSPILEEISNEYSLWIGKLNADDNPVKMNEYKIGSLPTTIVFENGKEVKRIIGAKPKHSLIKELNGWI